MNTTAKNIRLIKQVLWTDWDPIGINAVSTAADECDAYAPNIYKIIFIESGDIMKVAEYLNDTEKRITGQKANFKRNYSVAKKLFSTLNSLL